MGRCQHVDEGTIKSEAFRVVGGAPVTEVVEEEEEGEEKITMIEVVGVRAIMIGIVEDNVVVDRSDNITTYIKNVGTTNVTVNTTCVYFVNGTLVESANVAYVPIDPGMVKEVTISGIELIEDEHYRIEVTIVEGATALLDSGVTEKAMLSVTNVTVEEYKGHGQERGEHTINHQCDAHIPCKWNISRIKHYAHRIEFERSQRHRSHC